MNNYYFDADGLYTHCLPATPETLSPDNALRVAPAFRVGFYPCLNAGRDGWCEIEDHRQQVDDRGREIEGTGTPYWLPGADGGDTWQSPARYMDKPGPLPGGAILTRPEKTQAETDAERAAQLKSDLTALDAASARALRAVLLDTQNGVTPSGEDLAQLAVYEAEAVALRDDLAALGG